MSPKDRRSGQAKLGNSALAITLCKVAAMVIAMAAGMMMARFRTLEENGTLSQLQMAVTLMSSLLLLGLPNSLNYFITRAEDAEERKSFLSVYYSLSTILGVTVGIVLVSITPYIESYFNNPMISAFLYYLAVFPLTTVIQGSIENLMIAYGRTAGMIIFRIAHSVCYLSIVLLVQILHGNFSDFMRSYIIFETISALVVYYLAFRLSGGLRFSLNGAMLRRILAYSVPIGLSTVLGTLDIEMDKLIIGRFFTTEQMGLYSYAARELPVHIATAALTAVLLPQMARLMKKGEKQQAIKLWSDAIFISMSIMALISIGCFVYAPDVITLLYSEKYLPGVTVFRIYSLVLLLRCTYFGIVLNTTGNTRFIMYSSIAALGLNLVLNVLFYELFGFTGPAIATLLSIFIINMAQLVFSAKILGMPLSKIFPWKYCALLIGINAALGAAFFYIKKLIGLEAYLGEQWESVALGVMWGIVYVIILLRPLKKHWKGLNSSSLEIV